MAAPIGLFASIYQMLNQLGEQQRAKAESVDPYTGELRNKKGVETSAALGYGFDPMGSAIKTLSDPKASSGEKILSAVNAVIPVLGGLIGKKRAKRLEKQAKEEKEKQDSLFEEQEQLLTKRQAEYDRYKNLTEKLLYDQPQYKISDASKKYVSLMSDIASQLGGIQDASGNKKMVNTKEYKTQINDVPMYSDESSLAKAINSPVVMKNVNPRYRYIIESQNKNPANQYIEGAIKKYLNGKNL